MVKNHRRTYFTWVLIIGAFLVVQGQVTADMIVSLEGDLQVTKDGEGKIAAAKLVVCEGNHETTYTLRMDEKGEKIAAELSGENVALRGTLAEEEGVKWVSVREYYLVVVGTVDSEKNDDDEITGITFSIHSGETYRITIDATARKLATDHPETAVQVAGEYALKDGEKWLTVKKFSPLKTFTGTLEVEEDDDGNAEGAKLAVEEGDRESYHPILMDKTGKKMVSEAPWEVVKITGVFYKRNGRLWLKVHTFQLEEPDEGGGEDDEDDEEEEPDDGWEEGEDQ
ncbi:MAG: hypothetical protein ACYS47_06480 [Planctomycetota bacterium]|jgi:hypothetical protein